MMFLTMFFGAFWRYIDGRDWQPSNWNAALFAYLISLIFLYNSSAEYIWLYIWAGINILTGYETYTFSWFKNKFKRVEEHGWHEWDMWSRFMLPAVIGLLPIYTLHGFTLMNVLYPLLLIPVGLLWPTLTYFKKSTAPAEAISGAVILGMLVGL